jgi:hypothetical protein
VTLAKKTLLPVTSRVADLLRRTVDFAHSLPEFVALPVGVDRLTLLSAACPRLLLLYMAEVGFQFAVAPLGGGRQVEEGDLPAAESRDHGTSFGGELQDDGDCGGECRTSPPSSCLPLPTVQFAEVVRGFLRKCQALEISGSEYFYMRLITLFHAGSTAVESAELVARIYSEARQDLQDLSLHQHPTERLRYSTLLLTLHTLFGINCAMLQALFCAPVIGTEPSGFRDYVTRELRKNN